MNFIMVDRMLLDSVYFICRIKILQQRNGLAHEHVMFEF